MWLATDLTPLGVTQYVVSRLEENSKDEEEEDKKKEKEGQWTLGGRGESITVKGSRNEQSIRYIDNARNVDMEVFVELLFYKGHRGNNSEFDFRASGAYIFRPQTGGPVLLTDHTDIVITGEVFSE